ncbi:hypothetical protein [Pseudomonas lactucae]|uniref:DUF3077 domain-containing protein n=1 Tax=Pseudomonas lactucae TaxID=2813360 RepID=A0A9X0YBJ0_9PSED|nr:hypothetical protein [Pseudomonas lactucae]MBN2976157.1 hypothetical protein [Pseudomonas lactucae]MBN2989426.1 hypothetical protein [Pseudomonas lactucae]
MDLTHTAPKPLHCAEQLLDSRQAAGHLVEMAKVMVDRSLDCMNPQ